MWDLKYFWPTLGMLAVILVDFHTKPTLWIQRNKSFIALFVTEVLAIVLDLITSVMDNNYDLFPKTLLLWANVIFLMVYFIRQGMFFVYFRSITYGDRMFKGSSNLVFSIFMHGLELMALLSVWTGWICYVDDTGYHGGPLHWLVNLAGFGFIALTLWQCVLDRKRYDAMEYLAIWMLNTVLVLGNVVLILRPYHLTRDYFYSVAIVIIYLRFQDPNTFIHNETGLFNRRAYLQYMRELITHNKRVWVEAAVVSNYFSLKRIYGEKQVHKGIQEIGRFHRKNFKNASAFYLTGGRFVVVSTKPMTHEEYLTRIAAGAKEAANNGVALPATFVTLRQEADFHNADAMLGCIDAALDKAQEPGASELVCIDEAWAATYDENVQVQKMLNRAVETNAVECWLQPIYSVQEQKVVGAEALARIRDKDGNVIAPDRFIPIAEKNGQILNVGEQMFTKVCDFLHEEQDSLRFVNVNLSPVQCLSDGPTTKLMQIAENRQVDPSRMILEITEEVMIDDAVLRERMKALATKGFRLSLDDFGSGNANLNRTLSFRFNEIKLDRALVRHICEESYEVFPQMVKDIHGAGRDIVAEGIETKEMADYMAGLGCNYLQGYYYSKPLPMEEFRKSIVKARTSAEKNAYEQ